MLPKGQRIAHYRLVQRLKAGGMGQIYLAEDERLRRDIAIKVIEIDVARQEDVEEAKEAARLFQREAYAMARFNHDHILQVYDVGELSINDTYVMYMVMPFCPEGSLADWLHDHHFAPPLHPQIVSAIITQAAEALQLAHDHNMIHQDVKPENILVRQRAEQPDQLKLQLADFGIARLQQSTSESRTVRGTPFYMAPEQWQGHAVPETDQYSLAVMAYELLTGYRPFRGKNSQNIMYQHLSVIPRPPSDLHSRIPPALDDVILRALAKDPHLRFQSIAAFARAFQRACRNGHLVPLYERDATDQHVAVPALQPTIQVFSHNRPAAIHTQERPRSFRWRYIALMVCAVLLIAASAGVFLYLQLQVPEHTGPPPSQANHIAFSSLTSTAQSQRFATQTQKATTFHANATGTANAVQTATVSAVNATAVAATATAIVEGHATATVSAYLAALGAGRSPDLSDPMQDNSKGNQWDTLNTQNGSCGFTQGSYHASASLNTSTPCFAQATDFTSFAYQIYQTITKGNQGGMIFCGDSQNGNYYAFTISTSGTYTLSAYQNFQAPRTLASGTLSGINTNQANLLAVKVSNGSISLFVNMQPLRSINNALCNQGAIGVIAQAISANTDAAFAKAQVWAFS